MLDQSQQERGTTLIPTHEPTREYAYYKDVFDGYQCRLPILTSTC